MDSWLQTMDSRFQSMDGHLHSMDGPLERIELRLEQMLDARKDVCNRRGPERPGITRLVLAFAKYQLIVLKQPAFCLHSWNSG